MLALEKARKLIRAAPTSPGTQVVQQLLQSLETGSPFALTKLYEIEYAEFDLCLEIIEGWRLHRHGSSFRRQPRTRDAVDQRCGAGSAVS